VPKATRVGVVTYSDGPDGVQTPTIDRQNVRGAIDAQLATGSTATGEALQVALDQLAGNRARARASRPPSAIVLLSDGKTTAGRDPLDVARAAKRAGVPIYSVALGTADATIPDPRGAFGPPIAVPPDPETLKQISDSVANRVFFMGLSRAEQNKRFVLDGARPLVLADSINFLGSDIAPAGDDFEDEDDMDLKAIQSEIKSKELTKERALALRQELEDAEDKAAVKRTLSSLNAKIRANGWAEDGAAVSTESVNARIERMA
jgi:hypothetical protein